jgi:hypothetical protein
MPLRLQITIPPQIALDLDPKKVRAVLRSAGSRARRLRNALPPRRITFAERVAIAAALRRGEH